MAKVPCFKCPDRTAECHSVCEKWLAYEAERNAEYERVGKEKELAYALAEIERRRKADIATGRMRHRKCKRNG